MQFLLAVLISVFLPAHKTNGGSALVNVNHQMYVCQIAVALDCTLMHQRMRVDPASGFRDFGRLMHRKVYLSAILNRFRSV